MADKASIYETVTQRVLSLLSEGVAPWRKPWVAGETPQNAISGKSYRGINLLMLAMNPYSDPRWVTFKQSLDLGGCVRKGEKSSRVVYWSFPNRDQKDALDDKRVPFCRESSVFNVEQCEGLSKLKPLADLLPKSSLSPIESAQVIVDNMPKAPKIQHGGDSAHYTPMFDRVTMPHLHQFTTAESYYATLFHELTHATGAATRLNRPGIANIDSFGSDQYAQEELVAELGAAFLSAQAGIDSSLDQSAAYLSGWASKLRQDSRLILTAAGQAQRAADFVLGIKFGEQKEDSE